MHYFMTLKWNATYVHCENEACDVECSLTPRLSNQSVEHDINIYTKQTN